MNKNIRIECICIDKITKASTVGGSVRDMTKELTTLQEKATMCKEDPHCILVKECIYLFNNILRDISLDMSNIYTYIINKKYINKDIANKIKVGTRVFLDIRYYNATEYVIDNISIAKLNNKVNVLI